MRRLGKFLMGLLYPDHPLCLACGLVSRCRPLCADCAEELEQSRLPDAVKDNGPDGHVFTRSVWAYDGVGGKLVRRLKFDQVRAAALPLIDGLAETAGAMDLPQDTVVTWVTMPDSRWRDRVMDHAQVLAEGTAERLGLACRRLIRRVEKGGPLRHQLGLSREERRHNLDGSAACDEALSGTVLLIDDVLTTGATTETCAAALLAAGAEWVVVLTAVRA